MTSEVKYINPKEIWAERCESVARLESRLSVSRKRIAELESRLAEAERDAARYRWLRGRLHSTDWQYGDPPVCVITFRVPDDVSIGVGDNLNAAIDAALAGERHSE